MKKLSMTLLLAALMIVLAACGTNDKESGKTSGSDSENNNASETVSVEHELSNKAVEVSKNPEKVVVFDFGTLDTLDELGVEVAGLPRANVPGYLSKYDDDKYVNLGSLKEPDFEAIHAIEAGCYLSFLTRQADLYDQFSEIAPTIYVGIDTAHYMDSFKHNAELIGQIFGKEDEVKAELDAIDEKIAAIHEKASHWMKKR